MYNIIVDRHQTLCNYVMPMASIPLTCNPDQFTVSVPMSGVLSFSAGIATPATQTTLVGVKGPITGGAIYTTETVISTGLKKVSSAVSDVSLASISNKDAATNAVWRITLVKNLLNKPNPGDVTVVVDVGVNDSDGFLEGISINVQAVYDGS